MSKKEETFFDDAADTADARLAKEKEQNEAEWWNFEGKGGDEAHPEFKGTFVSAEFKEKTGDNGSYMCIMGYVRDLDDQLFKIWLSAGAAVRGLEDAAPAEGSLTMIRYEGQQDSSTSGRKFKAYSIVTDVQDGELWSSYRKAFNARSVDVARVTGKIPGSDISPEEAPF
jgi:hypothetical protein